MREQLANPFRAHGTHDDAVTDLADLRRDGDPSRRQRPLAATETPRGGGDPSPGDVEAGNEDLAPPHLKAKDKFNPCLHPPTCRGRFTVPCR